MQEESGQHERIVRVRVDDAKRRTLIQMADARDLQEQMREITARLGSAVIKIGDDGSDRPIAND